MSLWVAMAVSSPWSVNQSLRLEQTHRAAPHRDLPVDFRSGGCVGWAVHSLITSSRRRLLTALAVLVYLALALYLSRVLLPSDDEESYLGLGRLVVTGGISLFQDDATGQRMPLPFYVLGASQITFGRDLWAGRLVSIAIGLGVLLLTMAVARRLGGDLAAALAGLLLGTQGVVVGYYATAAPRALTALIFIIAVWLMLRTDLRWRCALGMAAASLLFLTRTNMFPAIPFFFAWALLGAASHAERLVVLLVTAAPPAAFFLSDPHHLKLLAHVPILHRFVDPLGYRSIFGFSAFRRSGFVEQIWSFPLFARRYESWTLAALGLAASGAALWRREGMALRKSLGPGVAVVTALWLWVLAWHYIIFRESFRLVMAYFPDFAPLAAALLGAGCAAVLARAETPRAARAILLIALAGAFTVSLVYIRHPLMAQPVPRPFRGDAVQQLERAATELYALVPRGERVFVFAEPITAYIAGLDMPLQHAMSPAGTLAPAGSDQRLVEKSGVWGLVEIERWLGAEARYAVISEGLMQAMEPLRPEAVARIRQLLRERFVRVGHVDGPPWLTQDVYRRVSAVPVSR
jgi:4-amino-4-deoxy-L-arabinose transferase-like glycosyltransferase